jgi:hypothetical protein
MAKLGRRDFLKLSCAAVVAPSLPVPQSPLTFDKLRRLVAKRTRQAYGDLAWEVRTGKMWMFVSKDEGGWIPISSPLNYQRK